jgi:LemA protein
MSINTKKYLIVGGFLFVSFLILTGMYNSLISSQESTREAWNRVEANYQRRADLIPALVETVKGYAIHEKETLTEVARLQSAWINAKRSGDMAKTQEIASQWDAVMGRFMTVVQSTPQLKADKHFSDLMTQLEGTENRILQERKRFGVKATVFNSKLRRFPNNIFAGFGDFERIPLFEAEADAKKMPKVKF